MSSGIRRAHCVPPFAAGAGCASARHGRLRAGRCRVRVHVAAEQREPRADAADARMRVFAMQKCPPMVFAARAFPRRGRIVIGEELEFETIGGADRPQLLVRVGAVFGAFALNARLKKAAGVFEVAHQVDGAVVGPRTRSSTVMWPSLPRCGSMEVTCTPAGRTVSMASMARVQEKAFSSKSSLRNRPAREAGRCRAAA